MKVAALFVEKDGVYYGLPDVDPWDEERDARLYAGPHPVAAHPPRQLWINYAALNFKRYGGEHNCPGNDNGLFAFALAAVEQYGGVLEHPAFSNAFYRFRLPLPPERGWNLEISRKTSRCRKFRGSCEVWQSAYGHRARKRTWLYYVGDVRPPELDWSRGPGTHQIGWFDRIKPTLGKKAANATPPAFRDDVMLRLARCASPKRDAGMAAEGTEPKETTP